MRLRSEILMVAWMKREAWKKPHVPCAASLVRDRAIVCGARGEDRVSTERHSEIRLDCDNDVVLLKI